MTRLTAEQILAAIDVGGEDVTVPEWGGDIRIGVMSGLGRDEFISATSGKVPVSRFQALLLAASMVDENGQPSFSVDQVELLQGKNKDVLDRLTAIAMRVNGIGKKAAEDLEKNSEAATSGDSGSASPSSTASP